MCDKLRIQNAVFAGCFGFQFNVWQCSDPLHNVCILHRHRNLRKVYTATTAAATARITQEKASDGLTENLQLQQFDTKIYDSFGMTSSFLTEYMGGGVFIQGPFEKKN
jgi:hypothetical protein